MIKSIFTLWLISISTLAFSQNTFWQNQDGSLKGTALMVEEGDMSTMMLEGISKYFDQQLSASIAKRKAYWHIDFSGRKAYENSVLQNRKVFSRMIGITDSLAQQTEMEYVSTTSVPAKVAENEYFTAYAVRWKLFGDVYGEGLLLQPKQVTKARVIVIPDADQIPELLIGTTPGLPSESQYARHLAENGCQVIIPTIINRSDSGSGSARLQRYTNQPHREWIYRQAYTFGRHIIGYEVEKILAVVNWFDEQNKNSDLPIGIAGWGEGGLLGFYSAAIDTRIDVALVSGYFGKREALWKEPIYRNVFGLLREFGDAEIAGLVVPRSLIIEYAPAPDVKGPPPPRPGSGGSRLTASAAPGRIITQPFEDVDSEVKKAKQLTGAFSSSIQFIHDHGKTVKPLNLASMLIFLKQLQPGKKTMTSQGKIPSELRDNFNPEERQLRQFSELE
ncbi:MAG TPA: hypothetical protein VFS31_13725, partial [Chitinophagaceae bacterium]|nr:hypothetical protein [Chitinophagaceae bacterium]